MATFVLGRSGKLYYAAAVVTTPVVGDFTTTLDYVGDVTVSDSADAVEVTSRASAGNKSFAQGHKTRQVTFSLKKNYTNAGFIAVKAAYDAGSSIALWAASEAKTTTGATGIAGNFIITNFEDAQPLTGEQVWNVTAQPAEPNYLTRLEVV